MSPVPHLGSFQDRGLSSTCHLGTFAALSPEPLADIPYSPPQGVLLTPGSLSELVSSCAHAGPEQGLLCSVKSVGPHQA